MIANSYKAIRLLAAIKALHPRQQIRVELVGVRPDQPMVCVICLDSRIRAVHGRASAVHGGNADVIPARSSIKHRFHDLVRRLRDSYMDVRQ
jgi:hypothetical protein